MSNIIQIVTGDEVTIGNCFSEVGEILPDAEGPITTVSICFVIPHSNTKRKRLRAGKPVPLAYWQACTLSVQASLYP